MNAIEQIFGPSTNPNPTVGKPAEELGQEDFLKLLVAQLKNQDPNNPADNGEFLGQIAQFSMVSGIDDLGVSFDGVAGSLYTNQAMQASQLVNRDVLIESNTGALEEGEQFEGYMDLPEDAAAIKLQIHDANGSLVNVMDLGSVKAGMNKFNWNGFDQEGNQLASGDYTVTAEGLVNGELEGVPVLLYSNVESVSVDRANHNVLLHLANQQSVNFSHIREYK